MLAVEKRQKRAALVKEARALLDKVEKEKRAMLGEETSHYEAIMADVDRIAGEIEREERVSSLEKELKTPIHEIAHREPEKRSGKKDAELRAFFGEMHPTGKVELRALQSESGEAGGYTVQAERFVAEMIKSIDDMTVVRTLARKFSLTDAQSMGFPSLDADPEDADWTGEITSADEDTQMDFGKRELRPKPITKLIKVSRELLRVSAIPMEAFVRERLAYKFAITEEKGFLTGSGAGQPLGMFTASANGIATARDVSSGNTSTAIGADGLINALHELKEGYQRNAVWIFHRDAMKQIRKLKDGNSQYLWQPGLSSNLPDTLLGKRFYLSEYAPSTFTTGLYVGLVGDLSYYWIADALSMELQRLNELYARTNQVGFIGRLQTDGAPVLGEAFARVKLA